MTVGLAEAARPIRVMSLIPTFWPRQGGAQMVLAAIAHGLGDRIENVVLTRGYAGSPRYERYDDLGVHRYPNIAPERWKDYATGAHHVPFPAKACVAVLDALGCMRPLKRLTSGVDLVHLHFPLPLGLGVIAMKPFGHWPLVVTVHGNADVYELPRALEPLTRAVLAKADVVVSVSEDLADYLRGNMGVREVFVVPNGVDTALYCPSERPETDVITLTSISRIVPRKNIPILIEAVESLVREGETRLKLVIAGTGPSEGEVARLASASSGATRFLGFVDEAHKRELLTQADVFVQLSTREGLSVATLEAMSCGLACLVSDRPGVREPVTPGVTGLLVRDPESVGGVKAVLKELIGARARLPDMKRAGRRVVEEKYSLSAMAEGYYRVYTELLKRGRR